MRLIEAANRKFYIDMYVFFFFSNPRVVLRQFYITDLREVRLEKEDLGCASGRSLRSNRGYRTVEESWEQEVWKQKNKGHCLTLYI